MLKLHCTQFMIQAAPGILYWSKRKWYSNPFSSKESVEFRLLMMADNKDEWMEPNTAKKASLLQMIHSFHITSYMYLHKHTVLSWKCACLIFKNHSLRQKAQSFLTLKLILICQAESISDNKWNISLWLLKKKLFNLVLDLLEFLTRFPRKVSK